ncbi:phosphatidylcholine-sterol acyltransferase [Pelomyxa schiedti]|nr:phosphatidylcholine-sterol acyltransferase [Pelomyxa schiedti]
MELAALWALACALAVSRATATVLGPPTIEAASTSSPCVSSDGGQICPPVVWVPGFGGSVLDFHVDDDSTDVPEDCPHGDLTYPYFVTTPECEYYITRLVKSVSGDTFYNSAGVSATLPWFGFWNSTTYSLTMKRTLLSWGYTEGKDMFAVGYDWRHSPNTLAVDEAWMDAFTNLIEQSYSINSMPISIISHSNGPPTVLAFLNAKSESWRSKFIASFIILSGNFIGQSNCVEAVTFSGNSWETLKMQSWEAWAWSMPSPKIYQSRPYISIPGAVFTVDQSLDFFRYNACGSSASDLSAFADTWALFVDTPRLTYPTLDMYCFYGTQLQIDNFWEFASCDVTLEPSTVGHDTNSDGDQDAMDNASCRMWADDATQTGHHFEYQEFPGVSHGEEPDNPDVLAAISKALSNYSPQL